jgi:hypothetical protein
MREGSDVVFNIRVDTIFDTDRMYRLLVFTYTHL